MGADLMSGPDLVVTPLPAAGSEPPRMQLVLKNWAGVTSALVQRLDADGNWRPVRTGEPAALSGGEWAGVDYEAPFGTDVYYQANSAQDSNNQPSAGPFRSEADGPWLIHPGSPTLSQPLSVWKWKQRQRPARRALFTPLGRATPVAVSQVRQADSYDLQVRTYDLVGEQGLDDLLDDGSPLLLNVPAGLGWNTPTQWVSVGDVTVDRFTDYGTDLWRIWTLPCTVVTRPAGGQQTSWSWDALAAKYATWNGVAGAYASWTDLLAQRAA